MLRSKLRVARRIQRSAVRFYHTKKEGALDMQTQKEIYVTSACLHRAAQANELTDGLVEIQYDGCVKAKINAPKQEGYTMKVCMSVGNEGCPPFTLRSSGIGGSSHAILTARQEGTCAVAVLLDKFSKPVKILTIKRFSDGFHLSAKAV